MPLAFQCGGLYQTIHDYDFVGKMDDTFYQELGRFTDRYPQLRPVLKSQIKQLKDNDNNKVTRNVGTEQHAALKARKFYTPNTVRKVLQYYSADYMLLGLSIPQWAEDILNQDKTYLV